MIFEKTYLSRVFEHAVNRDWIRKNPVKKATVLHKAKKKPSDISLRSFTKAEVAILIETAATIGKGLKSLGNCTWQEVLTFFFKTGLWENELLNLQWSDVYWNEGEFGAISLNSKDYTENISLVDYPEAMEIIQEHMQGKKNDDNIFTAEDVDNLRLSLFPIRAKSSLTALKCKDIKFENGSISIERNMAWQPKASTGFVPLSRDARALLENIAAKHGKSGFVFASPNGGRIRTNLW